MPLSDMRRSVVARQRPARRGRTHHCLRKIVRSGPDRCELFRHMGLDMRIGSAGAARRRQSKLSRYTLRVLECGLRIGIVLASRRIMNPKDLERRLIHEDFDGLGNHARHCAHRVADFGVGGDGQRRTEASCSFG